MTWAIFSIVANDISPSGCSGYTYHQYSFDPYVRPPFYQMSEQMIDDASINGGTHPAFPFLTGHGGANQVVLFGYLGLRLLPDEAIHIDPNLPPQIPHITYRIFYWRGWPIAATSNSTHTTLRRAPDTPALPSADPRFANASIPVHVGLDSNTTTHTLPLSSLLTITNRQIGTIPTVPNNLIQCHPVHSPSGHEAGQFPLSAIDGATSTKWQPSSSSLSSLTVSFSELATTQVHGFYFDWAQTPPVNATVLFHDSVIDDPALLFPSGSPQSNSNRSSGTGAQYDVITHMSNIALSKPWLATEDYNEVSIPVGNTTHVQLDTPVRVSRYATLLIAGNQGLSEDGGEDTGATVAEWVILGPGEHENEKGDGKARDLGKRKLKVKDAVALERGKRRYEWFDLGN